MHPPPGQVVTPPSSESATPKTASPSKSPITTRTETIAALDRAITELADVLKTARDRLTKVLKGLDDRKG